MLKIIQSYWLRQHGQGGLVALSCKHLKGARLICYVRKRQCNTFGLLCACQDLHNNVNGDYDTSVLLVPFGTICLYVNKLQYNLQYMHAVRKAEFGANWTDVDAANAASMASLNRQSAGAAAEGLQLGKLTDVVMCTPICAATHRHSQ